MTHTEAKRGQTGYFSLSSPMGGEGWGEEAQLFAAHRLTFSTQIPSPRPSPRSGGGREFALRNSDASALGDGSWVVDPLPVRE